MKQALYQLTLFNTPSKLFLNQYCQLRITSKATFTNIYRASPLKQPAHPADSRGNKLPTKLYSPNIPIARSLQSIELSIVKPLISHHHKLYSSMLKELYACPPSVTNVHRGERTVSNNLHKSGKKRHFNRLSEHLQPWQSSAWIHYPTKPSVVLL